MLGPAYGGLVRMDRVVHRVDGARRRVVGVMVVVLRRGRVMELLRRRRVMELLRRRVVVLLRRRSMVVVLLRKGDRRGKERIPTKAPRVGRLRARLLEVRLLLPDGRQPNRLRTAQNAVPRRRRMRLHRLRRRRMQRRPHRVLRLDGADGLHQVEPAQRGRRRPGRRQGNGLLRVLRRCSLLRHSLLRWQLRCRLLLRRGCLLRRRLTTTTRATTSSSTTTHSPAPTNATRSSRVPGGPRRRHRRRGRAVGRRHIRRRRCGRSRLGVAAVARVFLAVSAAPASSAPGRGHKVRGGVEPGVSVLVEPG